MDEATTVLERLRRIEALERGSASAPQLLGELRALVREAETWARREGGERPDEGPAKVPEGVEGMR